ncbi:MAG TPA: four helix bundle protein [Flavobacteriaceae bacterium]|nr:four helix bundle protein [Flavobacteriaceae bacterium]
MQTSNKKPYDLEERTFLFAKNVRVFIKTLNRTAANIEDIKQVVRSSGSIAANYIEANEALSKKDFVYRVKISRKEAKESVMWLRLINETNTLTNKKEVEELIKEAGELKKILSAIIEKSK